MAQRHGEVVWLVVLLAVGSALEWVRVGSFQLSDLLLLLILSISLAKVLYRAGRIRLPVSVMPLLGQYAGVLTLLLLCSFLSLRLSFIPLDQPTFLQRPLLFSLARLLQFASTVCGFLWLLTAFRRWPAILPTAMSWYYRAGVASAVYGLACYAAVMVLHVTPVNESIFGVLDSAGDLRLRGFFNEGGPFGLYLVSVTLAGLLRRHMSGKRLGLLSLMCLGAAFLLSKSFAAILVVAILLGLWLVTKLTPKQAAMYGALAVVSVAGLTLGLNLPNRLAGYMLAFETVEEQVDPNLATGRVSGVYIVPRMIAAHPLTGIGIGNYPFMRNDPLYLGPLPLVTFSNDLSGLGIPGLTAEIGVPATLWLLLLTMVPYLRARKEVAAVAIAAAFQPVAHAAGAQVTLFYPWFLSAGALAMVGRKDWTGGMWRSNRRIQNVDMT